MTIQPYHEEVRQYVEQHTHFDDEPLVLALRYIPNGADDKVYVLEVAENVGLNVPDPDKEICGADYATHWVANGKNGQWVHLAITNPIELKAAVAERWPDIELITEAIRAGRFEVVYQREDAEAKDLLALIGGA
jgi:hypothetical protein